MAILDGILGRADVKRWRLRRYMARWRSRRLVKHFNLWQCTYLTENLSRATVKRITAQLKLHAEVAGRRKGQVGRCFRSWQHVLDVSKLRRSSEHQREEIARVEESMRRKLETVLAR